MEKPPGVSSSMFLVLRKTRSEPRVFGKKNLFFKINAFFEYFAGVDFAVYGEIESDAQCVREDLLGEKNLENQGGFFPAQGLRKILSLLEKIPSQAVFFLK